MGVIADGGGAAGYLARGGGAWGRYVITPRYSSPGAAEALAEWQWLIGAKPGRFVLLKWALIVGGAVSALAAMVVLIGYAGWRTEGDPQARGTPSN